MLKRLFFASSFILVAVLGWYFFSIQPVAHFEVPLVDFEIKSGSSIDSISNSLSEAKLIRSRTAFKITVVRLGIANKIQAGFFKISPNMNATEIAEALTHAFARQVRVTIPEGLRKEEINLVLEKAFTDFKDNNYNSAEFSRLSQSLEGKLFPDTYDFSPEATAQDVINRLTSRFDSVMTELRVPPADTARVLILASLLEREAGKSDEMPLIAGVIQKRLENGWPLQIDATVQYFLATKTCKKNDCDWWKNALSISDLQQTSPYNTYLNKGLPPTPICSPGRDAIAAAASPKSTSAWFYLHDLNGQIHFADTVEQHNQNVCLYLKKDCPATRPSLKK